MIIKFGLLFFYALSAAVTFAQFGPKIEIRNGAVLFIDTIGTTPAVGAGTRMMWIPSKAAFRAGYVSGPQWNDSNIGQYSFVGGGWSNLSSNECSFVGGGINNTASGLFAFVGGGANNSASSNSSCVVGGQSNIASGGHSFIGGGFSLFARSSYEVAFGVYNTDYSPQNNDSDRIFVVGNGTSNATRSNAITVLKNGNVGLGTQQPAAKLVVQDGAFLLDGNTGSVPVSGFGTRLMWIPNKAAFRAGNITTALWEDSNIGLRSFVGGGFNNNASATNAFVAGGQTNSATGQSSFAAGASNVASGVCAISGGGQFNLASATYASVIGGLVNEASGENSFIGGGTRLLARSVNEVVFGAFNVDFTPTNDDEDHILVVGNGTSMFDRSNALTLLRNGNITIAGTLSELSDARLKKEIQLINNAIEKIGKLRGVHFRWDDTRRSDKRLQSGFLAQEVEVVMPELIREDSNGVKSVIYSGILPYIVEGVKEISNRLESTWMEVQKLQEENGRLRAEIVSINDRLNELQRSSSR